MIEHSVTEFFYFDELQFKRTANSQSYITNKLVPDRTKETVKKKLKLSLTSQKKKHNEEDSWRHHEKHFKASYSGFRRKY